MKVALCKSHFMGPVSGADEVLTNYATHLHKSAQQVIVVLLYAPTQDDRYHQRLVSAGVEVSYVIKRPFGFAILRRLRELLPAFWFLFLFRPRAPGWLRKTWQVALNLLSRLHYRRCHAQLAAARPDVIHVFTPDAGAALMIRAGHALRIPVLYHEMGTPDYLPMLDPYYRQLETVLPLCAGVAALSPRLAVQWEERFPFLRSVSVLPLIIDGHNECELVLPSWARAEEVVFGFAARIEEGKGILPLLEAFAALRRQRSSVLLRIAGTGRQLLQAKGRATELDLADSCEFVGSYAEAVGRSAFLMSLDVFVLPSLAEGTPNSIIEAMAHGLPVIATNVGGISDLVDPQCGILIPPRNGPALVEAMNLLASDLELRTRMGHAARERYSKHFSPAAVLDLLDCEYRRLLGMPNGDMKKSAAPAHPWLSTHERA